MRQLCTWVRWKGHDHATTRFVWSSFWEHSSTNDTGGRARSNAKHKFETEQMIPKIGSLFLSLGFNGHAHTHTHIHCVRKIQLLLLLWLFFLNLFSFCWYGKKKRVPCNCRKGETQKITNGLAGLLLLPLPTKSKTWLRDLSNSCRR